MKICCRYSLENIFKVLFMSPTSKKLEGHIALRLFIHPSICLALLLANYRDNYSS